MHRKYPMIMILDRYRNIASDMGLSSDYILCCWLFDVWLPGAPQLVVKSVEWHSLT